MNDDNRRDGRVGNGLAAQRDLECMQNVVSGGFRVFRLRRDFFVAVHSTLV